MPTKSTKTTTVKKSTATKAKSKATKPAADKVKKVVVKKTAVKSGGRQIQKSPTKKPLKQIDKAVADNQKGKISSRPAQDEEFFGSLEDAPKDKAELYDELIAQEMQREIVKSQRKKMAGRDSGKKKEVKHDYVAAVVDMDRTKTEASMHREWGRYWLDHWGTIERCDFELFVSEPYHLQPADAERAIEFAEAIDMPIQIDYGAGWHAPGQTDRIIIGGKL